MSKIKLTEQEKGIVRLKQNRVRWELSVDILKVIQDFKSVTEPECKLRDKDIDVVLSTLLNRRLELKL